MPGSTEHRRLDPTIRVFVSSTFTDLRHERDALQVEVFPRLELLCARRGFQFQAIDLRWGISTEATLDHRAMQVCFTELAQAQTLSPRPNFLILLGDRYGWRPLPEQLAATEYSKMAEAAQRLSSADTLRRWYARDENAITTSYILRSRLHHFGDGVNYVADANWASVEAALWRIINLAFPPEWLASRFRIEAEAASSIVSCQASATEQEIWRGALQVADAAEHVVAWYRRIENLSEMVGETGLDAFTDLASDGSTFDDTARDALNDLKAAIGRRLGRGVVGTGSARLQRIEYDKRPCLDVTTGHLAGMCNAIHGRLAAIVNRQMDEYWEGARATGSPARRLQIEIDTHRRFGEQRGAEREFVGREAELTRIGAYLDGPSREPLVVTGPSGSGKTALMARAAARVASGAPVILQFIGISPRSSELRPLLESLCAEIRERHGVSGEPPTELEQLVREFAAALGHPSRPLVVFLDGLDVLGDADQGRWLSWLPEYALADGVKVVLSCLSDRKSSAPATEPVMVLRQRELNAASFIPLDALGQSSARTLFFDRWLANHGRRLNSVQTGIVELLLAVDGCRQPLYLKLLFEEARLWRSYDPVTAPGQRVTDLLDLRFSRLCQPSQHGDTATIMLAYLSVARHGLSETELLQILFRDADYRAFLGQAAAQMGHVLPDGADRVPIAPCVRVWHDLAPYLVRQSAPGAVVITFYHRGIAEYARARFAPPSAEARWHRKLADWFVSQSDYLDPAPDHRVANARKADELPWQMERAGLWSTLDALYGVVSFLEALFLAGLTDNVVNGFGEIKVRAAAPHGAAIRDAALRTSVALRARPDLSLQTLRNDLAFAPGPEAASLARTIELELERRGTWLRAETAAPGAGPDKTTVWRPREASVVQALSARRDILFVATEEGAVEEYRLESGQRVGVRQLGTSAAVWMTTSLAGRLAWRTRDGVVHVSGSPQKLPGRQIADAGAFLGDRLLLATGDQRLVLWDAQAGTTTTLAEGLAPRPISVAVSASRQYALVLASLSDGSQFVARVHDEPAGIQISLMDALPTRATACDIAADGQHVVLALLDRTLRLYGPDNRELLRILYEIESRNGVSGSAQACALPPDGTADIVLLATNSGKIGLWQLTTGRFSEIGAYASVDLAVPLLVLSLLDGDARYVVSTYQEVQITAAAARPAERPPTSVSVCALGQGGWTAVASRIGQYVEWWRGTPLTKAAFCSVPHPTVLAFIGADGTLIAGNREGQVWRQRPGEGRPAKEVFLLFDEPVAAIFATLDGRAVAASYSGTVRVVNFVSDDVSPVIPGDPRIIQLKMMRCNARGDLLSWTLGKDAAATHWIGIIGPGGQRETIYESPRSGSGVGDVAVAPDGESIAIIGGHGVDLYRRQIGRWRVVLHADRRVERVGFCGNEALAVIPFEPEGWLELWSLRDGLKTIAAVNAPVGCQTLAADAGRVLIGSRNAGFSLWSLRRLGRGS